MRNARHVLRNANEECKSAFVNLRLNKEEMQRGMQGEGRKETEECKSASIYIYTCISAFVISRSF